MATYVIGSSKNTIIAAEYEDVLVGNSQGGISTYLRHFRDMAHALPGSIEDILLVAIIRMSAIIVRGGFLGT